MYVSTLFFLSDINWNILKTLISAADLHRLEQYTKNLADRYLVTDLFETLAYLFFSGYISPNLSKIQSVSQVVSLLFIELN